MRRFIEGVDRGQTTLFPECLEDWGRHADGRGYGDHSHRHDPRSASVTQKRAVDSFLVAERPRNAPADSAESAQGIPLA